MTPQEELKQLGETINRNFDEFKKSNDARLKAIEEKGHAPADVEAKTNKISEAITKLEEKFEAVQTAMSRIVVDSTGEKDGDKIIRLSKKHMSSFMKKGAFSEESFKAYQQEMKDYMGEGNEEFKTLSVGSDPDGGYFVRPQMAASIGKKVFESSPMRALADSITISTDAYEEFYDNDEPASGWVGEQTTRSVTANNVIKKLRIEAHELHSSPKATQKLLDDSSIDIESWHAGKVQEKFARDEATAFITGNGVAKPRGILSYASGDGFNMIEQISSNSSANFDADDLIDVQDSLLEAFQNGASWLMRRASWSYVRKLKDGEGRYLVAPGGNLLSGNSMELLGKPVSFAADMPAIGADSLSVAYGNYKSGYMIVDRIGIRVLRDPFTSKGSVIFYTTKRVGGGVHQFQTIKLLKLSA